MVAKCKYNGVSEKPLQNIVNQNTFALCTYSNAGKEFRKICAIR